MAKQSSISYEPQTSTSLGEINITTAVLETIAAQALKKVEGVVVDNRNFQKVSGRWFSVDRDKIGARVYQSENAIAMDVEISVKYGYSVPEVAMNAQYRVKEQILFMTDLVISEVNVHILSVETPSPGTELFHLEDENGDAVDQ